MQQAKEERIERCKLGDDLRAQKKKPCDKCYEAQHRKATSIGCQTVEVPNGAVAVPGSALIAEVDSYKLQQKYEMAKKKYLSVKPQLEEERKKFSELQQQVTAQQEASQTLLYKYQTVKDLCTFRAEEISQLETKIFKMEQEMAKSKPTSPPTNVLQTKNSNIG